VAVPADRPAEKTGAGPVPFPPLDLMSRVGSVEQADDPQRAYAALGEALRGGIVDLLPPDWSWSGRRALDFGCGAGRTLRHFMRETAVAELWGCDIDDASIAWLQGNLSPPLRVFRNAEGPPLPQPDGYFDLIWAISVFTHITDDWSEWLLELHRVMAPSGLLIATFLAPGWYESLTGEPWKEDELGMTVIRHDAPWEQGGPMVFHSPWWVHAHWGRAFEILEYRSSGFGADPEAGDDRGTQGYALMRKRSVDATTEMLERPEPGEPREVAALARNLALVQRERAELQGEVGRLDALRGEPRPNRGARAVRRLRRALGRIRPGARG
jgi:SAM-dependent methyltransferase